MLKTSLPQKAGLLILGVILAFVILELGLRLGGWVFLGLQEAANRGLVANQKEYRILCLGESTTALGGNDSYPRQLERILNSRQKKVQFKVINKGVPATTTDQILARVPQYLKDYQPQMVIAMIGVNDPPDLSRPSFIDRLTSLSRAAKLVRMIVEHLSAKKTASEETQFLNSLKEAEPKIDLRPSVSEYGKLATFYRGANRPEDEFRVISKALALDPNDSGTNYLLGLYWERQGECSKSLAAYQKALSSSKDLPEQVALLTKTAECFYLLGEYRAAEEYYLKVYKLIPDYPGIHKVLADVYLLEGKYHLAQKHLEEQLRLDPGSEETHQKLLYLYHVSGQEAMATALLQKMPGLEADSGRRAKGINAATMRNYQSLYRTLRERKMLLVAVQYPLRSVELLKQVLAGSEGVLFISNENNFKAALKNGPTARYFSDRFAGDFGHCTAAGNELLARNVAEAILTKLGLSER